MKHAITKMRYFDNFRWLVKGSLINEFNLQLIKKLLSVPVPFLAWWQQLIVVLKSRKKLFPSNPVTRGGATHISTVH